MQFVEGEVGSPAEVAKLYMQNRPPWASPSTSRIGYKSTSPTGIQLFKEGTPYSLGFSSSSPSKVGTIYIVFMVYFPSTC